MGCISAKEVPPPATSFEVPPPATSFEGFENPLEIQLQNSTYDNTVPFMPNFTRAKVVRVYDGDTVHVAAIVNGGVHRFMIRAYGYDSPEKRTKNSKEKEAGLAAMNVMIKRVEGKIIQIKILPIKEKFGRLLAILSDEQGDINEWMIKNGYGKPYFGGHKEEFEDVSHKEDAKTEIVFV